MTRWLVCWYKPLGATEHREEPDAEVQELRLRRRMRPGHVNMTETEQRDCTFAPEGAFGYLVGAVPENEFQSGIVVSPTGAARRSDFGPPDRPSEYVLSKEADLIEYASRW